MIKELIKIKRKYDLSDNIYNTFLQKEVRLTLLKRLIYQIFYRSSKDVGGGFDRSKTSVNYILAFVLEFIPLILLFTIFFINNAIQNTEDISN
jgi:hypothetical protein